MIRISCDILTTCKSRIVFLNISNISEKKIHNIYKRLKKVYSLCPSNSPVGNLLRIYLGKEKRKLRQKYIKTFTVVVSE